MTPPVNLPIVFPARHCNCFNRSTVRTLLQDLRHGLHTSLRSPGFTLVAVLTLAIGIAANTTVFSWVEMMMLRPIPGATRAAELVSFEGVGADKGPLTTSYPDFQVYRDHLKLVSGLAAATPVILNIGDEDHAERVWGETVSGNYFAVLGVRSMIGRMFSQAEYGDTPGAYPVVVISQSLWKRRFNADPRAIGTTLLVNQQPLTIIGVAPPDFHGSMPGLFLELWAPITMESQMRIIPKEALNDRNARMFTAIARLGPGVSIEKATAECSSVAHRLAETYPRTNGGTDATLLPVRRSHFGGQRMMEGPLRILMAACGLLFLVVCANVANLLLARATSRRKEFSLRLAMGSGRFRLLRAQLAESLVLAAMGVTVGVPLAMWMTKSLELMMPRGANVPFLAELPLNADILLFNAALCAGACLLSGIAPALQGARTSLNEVLKEGGRSGIGGARSQRLRNALVAAEVALALVTIIGAGLFAKSFQMARRIDPGFDPRNVLIAHIDLSAAGYGPTERRLLCDRLRDQMASQPGIVGATWAEVIPLWFTGNPVEGIQIDGYVPALSESMKISRNMIGPGYFDLMRIPLLQGREFTAHDTENTQHVMIVNQTFTARYFSGREALGRRVQTMGEWYTIVGVARDSKYEKPTEDPRPYFYVPLRQAYGGLMPVLHLRTAGNPERVEPLLRHQLVALDPNVRVFDAMPMSEAITAGIFGQRVAANLLSVLGFGALLLAATGLYSVMAYSVAQRTQEIGVRIALGASARDVSALMIREGMVVTAIGVGIGMALALLMARGVASLLIHVNPTDPIIFGSATLFLAAVALAANYLPARRATRIDPNDALRCE